MYTRRWRYRLAATMVASLLLTAAGKGLSQEKHADLRAVIEEQFIFYCLEKKRKLWRFFDARTYRSAPFDEEYLISLMEQLL